MRLDAYLVEHNFFESRNRAQEAIKEGLVLVDSKVIAKPSLKVAKSSRIDVAQKKFYVSRAAKKLEEYIKEFTLPIAGARALDIGSSTGGFTQILLENGAKSVDCVDVGKEQLHQSIRKESRVSIFEQTDIRDFYANAYDLIVSDVSFISLLKIIEKVNSLIKFGGTIALLFKPQFEVGLHCRRDSRGVVLDRVAIKGAKEQFLMQTAKLGWRVVDTRESRVAGKQGNQEIFYTFIKERA